MAGLSFTDPICVLWWMYIFTLQNGKAFISILFYLFYILERPHGGGLPMAAGQFQHLLPASFPDPGAGRVVSLFFFFFPQLSLFLCFAIPMHTEVCLRCHHHCGWGAGQCPLSCHLHTGTQCSLTGENTKDWPRMQVKVDFVTLD